MGTSNPVKVTTSASPNGGDIAERLEKVIDVLGKADRAIDWSKKELIKIKREVEGRRKWWNRII